MRFADWNELYSYEVRRALKPIEYESSEDIRNNWFYCLQILNRFEKNLYNKYYNFKTGGFNIRYREWFSLCHKYIRQARKENNHMLGDFLFSLWNTGCYYFKRHKDPRSYLEVSRPITDEELEFANKYLIPELETLEAKEAYKNTIWYSKESRVITYRNINAIVDDQWEVGHILYKGSHKQFPTDWDWWYNIDRFLDLEKNWKKEGDNK